MKLLLAGLIVLFLFLAVAWMATGPKSISISANFAADIVGEQDTRPGTWGTAGVAKWTMPFYPSAGQLVRITHLKGDLVAWPSHVPKPRILEVGAHVQKAGVLLSFQTTGPEGSKRCDFCADNTMLYVQNLVGFGSESQVRSFDSDVSAGGLLLPDSKLVIVTAAWLNSTGSPIHIEATFTAAYRYE